jgi:oligoendopeptidase F
LTYITNILLEDKGIDDRLRRFPTPEAGRHLGNEIDQQTVDTMAEVVVQNYGLVQEFYGFKKQVLGLRRLYDYDRYAPVTRSHVKFSFDQAREMILTAFRAFSPVVGDAAAEFFHRRWIDAPPRYGKTGGAFCHYVTPDVHPYVFMNYTGDARSVLTLAHELGHGVHAYLARRQTYLNFSWPLTIAETASVFGEMVVFENLKDALPSRQEKFALHFGKIEEIFATVFRQISLYRFEQDLHRDRRERGELPVEAINALWRRRQEEMFGRSVTLTPDYDIWWSYIPHFVHTPFYVYAYAFGELLTLSLYARYRREGRPFVDRYLEMLAAGGSKSPRELLEPMGVDLTRRDFWQGGMEIIRQMIKEVERLR